MFSDLSQTIYPKAITHVHSNNIPSPELLAPAGNWECARAAVENGANAIYFGLQSGFNARARAANFDMETLPQLMAMLHRQGVLGYVTLNTLVFTDELPALEQNVRQIAAAGVDAVLVQDLGAARLIRKICPELPIHASTQMTMTCAESIQVARELGLERVVLARELSIAEIKKITANTDMPVETFVHGALCVAYSGQCLTSESLGGRSANRGQCAQACRLDYQLITDGKPQDLGDMKYLLSPQDLAGIEYIPELIQAGVCSLKIEGRLKTPEYVANIVKHYREAIDSAVAGIQFQLSETAKREMEMSFSRGFSPGWLQGNDHKRLVPATSSSKRGVLVGTVIRLRGEQLEVELTSPLACGDGVVLEGDRAAQKEIGGRIYEIFKNGRRCEEPTQGRAELAFQHGLLRDAHVYPGQQIWQTDDPRLTKRLQATFQDNQLHRRVPIRIAVRIAIDQPIELDVTCHDGIGTKIIHDHRPQVAQRHSIDSDVLEKQLGRLGGTAYLLESLEAKIEGNPMVPLSVLGAIRKELVATLDHLRMQAADRKLDEPQTAIRMLGKVPTTSDKLESSPPVATLRVLCRTMAQVEQALASQVKDIYADFHDLREYHQAVERVHAEGGRIHLATLRILKPGERGLFLHLAKFQADGWLVRNLAALQFAKERNIPTIADFSLNVTNPLTAQWLRDLGAQRLTASYDLNRDQLLELVAAMPGDWLEVVIHQHMPMFHMEHCVFCSVLSPGTNKSNCGRPCDRHDVRLKDRVGVEHVLHADIGCRNTLFNGVAQSGAEAVSPLLQRGVSEFRIELLRDAPMEETKRIVELYRELIAGRIEGKDVWQSLKAHNRVGVTRGTLEHPRNPLAVL